MIIESELTKRLGRAIRLTLPGSVWHKYNDASSAGIPDASVTWRGVTVWIEVKRVNPRLLKRELQHHQMLRLAEQGFAIYVVYSEDQRGVLTTVCPPVALLESLTWTPEQYKEAWLCEKGTAHNSVAGWLFTRMQQWR